MILIICECALYINNDILKDVNIFSDECYILFCLFYFSRYILNNSRVLNYITVASLYFKRRIHDKFTLHKEILVIITFFLFSQVMNINT